MQIHKKIKKLLAALLIVIGISSVNTPAQAQLIGGCPSIILPPPCIIVDYKKLTELAREHAQQVERLQGLYTQAKETRENTLTIGQTISGVQKLDDINLSFSSSSLTNVKSPQNDLNKLINEFGENLYAGTNPSADAVTQANTNRIKEGFLSASDSYATALYAQSLTDQSVKRVICLGRASEKTTDLRGDWAINSQIKLEMARQNHSKNQLLSIILQNSSTHEISNITQSISGKSVYSSPLPDIIPGERDPAWSLQDELDLIEDAVRTTKAALSIASGTRTIQEDVISVTQQHNNALSKRDAALEALKIKAAEINGRSANLIVNSTVAQINSLDAAMEGLRNRPIDTLAQAFEDRNINPDDFVKNDVDPRQFIGTWVDPLKNQNILNVANALLSGPLDSLIDGDNNNDEFRQLVINYNDARLEEAWLRLHASEVNTIALQNAELLSQEQAIEGYQISEEAATKRLEELVLQANTLADQISKSNNPQVVALAKRNLDNINSILNGEANTVDANQDNSQGNNNSIDQ